MGLSELFYHPTRSVLVRLSDLTLLDEDTGNEITFKTVERGSLLSYKENTTESVILQHPAHHPWVCSDSLRCTGAWLDLTDSDYLTPLCKWSMSVACYEIIPSSLLFLRENEIIIADP